MELEPTKEFYLEWIKEETNNPSLSGNETGVIMAIKILLETDPYELLSANEIVSESIDNISHTYQVNEEGIPIKVIRWIKPYYMLGSV